MLLPDEMWASLERIQEVRCVNQANQSPQVAAIDAKTHDLAVNWNPTGFYTPDDLERIVNQIIVGGAQARLVLAGAARSTSDAAQVVAQAYAYLNRNDERAKLYQDAIKAARAKGAAAVNAPGLKIWVLQSLVNISQAYVTVAVLDCRTTWLDTVGAIAEGITSTAKRIGGVAVQATDTIINAAEGAFGATKVLAWGLVAAVTLFGAVFAWRHAQRFYYDKVLPSLPPPPEPE